MALIYASVVNMRMSDQNATDKQQHKKSIHHSNSRRSSDSIQKPDDEHQTPQNKRLERSETICTQPKRRSKSHHQNASFCSEIPDSSSKGDSSSDYTMKERKLKRSATYKPPPVSISPDSAGLRRSQNKMSKKISREISEEEENSEDDLISTSKQVRTRNSQSLDQDEWRMHTQVVQDSCNDNSMIGALQKMKKRWSKWRTKRRSSDYLSDE